MKRVVFFLLSFCFILSEGFTQVAYYPFNGNANDESGFENHGAVNGATLTADRFGNASSAYQFDGSSTYIDMGSDPSLDLQDGFSITAWVNSTGNGIFQTIAGRGYYDDGDYWLALYNNGTNKVIRVWLEGEVHNGTIPVPSGWNHIALSAQTGTNEVKLYLNGILYDQWTTSKDLIGTSLYNLRIGNDNSDEDYFFDGKIDDIMIYQKALSSSDVAAIANTFELTSNTGSGFGNALHFEDLDYVSFPPEIVSNLENFTFETWVKWDGGDTRQRIFEFGYGNNEYVYFTADRFGIFRSSGRQEICLSSDCQQTLPVGSWHHIAVTLDIVNDTGIIYLDGNEIARDDNFTNNAVNLFIPFLPFNRIGSAAFTAFTFHGALDETRLWNGVKTPEQIKEFLGIPITGSEVDLVYYFSYDQGVPGGDNTGIDKILNGNKSESNGDLSGFELDGNTSNFIKSEVKKGAVQITKIEPFSAIPGEKVTIYGSGIAPFENFNKVFFGTEEAVIVSVKLNSIEVLVPEVDFQETGNTGVIVLNSGGSSQEYDFTILYNGTDLPFTYTETVIVDFLRLAHRVHAADFNNDGYTDIVCSALDLNDKTLVLFNDTFGNFPLQIELSAKGSEAVSTGDIDRDGDIDILSAERSGEIIWYENDGTGNFIKNSIEINYSEAAQLADIDNDGDLDIVIGSNTNQNIVSFENDGSGNFSPKKIIYQQAGLRTRNLNFSDIDGDSDLDLIAGDRILGVWLFKNDGSGSFGPPIILKTSDVRFVEGVSVADINKDGKMDILSASNEGGSYWYANNGTETFSVNSIPNGRRGGDIFPADLNGNGNIDLLIPTYTTGTIREMNDGLGSFERIDISRGRFEDPRDMVAADIDSDGDLDIISTWHIDNKIVLYEHVFSSNDIKSFSLSEQVEVGIPDVPNHTVDITVGANTVLNKLTPTFTLSKLAVATIGTDNQISNQSILDFTNPVIYTITAENGDRQDWIVTVTSLPGDIILNPPVTITQSSGTINWTPATNATYYDVEVSTNEFLDVDKFTSDNTSLSVDLAAGTTYQVRVRGGNEAGMSETFSNSVEFTTIPPNPESLSMIEIGSASSAIQWDLIQGATSYQLDVARDINFNDYVAGYESRGVSSKSESIIGLLPGTTYWARLRAVNVTGISSDSEILSFQTVPAAPLLESTGTDHTSISLNWQNVKGADGYQLEMVTSEDTTYVDYNSKAITGLIASLSPATEYHFRIRANNTSGASDYSNSLKLLTIPATPDFNAIDSLSQTGVYFSWEHINGAEEYLLEVSKDQFATRISGYTPKFLSINSDKLNSLEPGTNYQGRLQSKNATGKSPYSKEVIFLTLPATPNIRDASSVSTSSFNANWDKVFGAANYLLEVATDPRFTQIFITESVTNALSFEITGLDQNTEYWYRIRAGNSSGESPNSGTISVQTAVIVQALVINSLTFDRKFTESMSSSPISLGISGGQGEYTVTLRYKGITGLNWDAELILPLNEEGLFSFNVNRGLLDQMGFEFEIEVFDGNSDVKSDHLYIYWSFDNALSDSIPMTSFGGTVNNWQIFSIPYELEDNLIETIFNEMGPFEYQTQWRLMSYLNTGNGEGSFVDAGSGINRIELGKGYWFNALSEISVHIGPGKVNTTIPFSMSLFQGWNQIGNPYNVPISWNSVRSENGANGLVSGLIVYNQENSSFDVGDVIQPFSGGFVWAEEATSVNISPRTNSLGGRRGDNSITNLNIDDPDWILPISLHSNTISYELGAVGMHPDALEHKDVYDRMALPRFIQYLEMYSIHDGYFYPWFSTDIRETQEEQQWNFTVESNIMKGNTKLVWDNAPLQESTSQVWLVDHSEGRIIDMKQTGEYKFTLDEKRTITIHYSRDPAKNILPSDIMLGDAYPNPTNTQTTIPITLTDLKDTYGIELEIYNLQGQKIKTLAYGNYTSGFYEFKWNIIDKEGKISSGVYIYRLSFNDKALPPIQKRLIIKN